MPLPAEPLQLEGGCNCQAIRYRIDVPALDQRPPHPTSPGGQVKFPFVTTDHCNDCRRAVSAILPVWLCTPSSMISVSLAPRSKPPVPLTSHVDDGKRSEATSNTTTEWHPANEIVRPSAQNEEADNWLRFFKSSELVTRSFCGRCGTNLFYSLYPNNYEGYPDLFDVLLATIDREYLEKEWMRPDMHLWWDYGIEWVKDWTRAGLPTHGDYRLS